MLRLPTVFLAILMVLGSVSPTMAQAGQNGGDGQTDVVTFYGHVFGNGLDEPMPANTEAPIGEDNYGIGLGVNCESVTPALDDCREESGNKLALFSTAGFVDVENRAEFQQNGGYGLLHNERGQTKDILLDTTQPIKASVYITLDAHGWPVSVFNGYGTACAYPHPENVPCLYPSWGWDPGVFTDVVVEATLYHADLGSRTNSSQAPPVEEAITSGQAEIVAEGRWGPDVVMNGIPGSPNVNEFEIDLGTPKVSTIPKSDDFFLVYSVYQETAGNNYFLRGPARWWSGEFFPPTFELPVKNAFTVERVVPNLAHGKLAILGVINTPWGSYDVAPDSIELTIRDPSRNLVEPTRLDRFGDVSVAHGGHYLPVNITWIWGFAREAKPGTYTFTVSAENFQGSAQASCTAEVTFVEHRSGLTVDTVEEGICGTQSVSDAYVDDLSSEAGDGAS